jgi:Big-like domain-containing protein/invasin-like protein
MAGRRQDRAVCQRSSRNICTGKRAWIVRGTPAGTRRGIAVGLIRNLVAKNPIWYSPQRTLARRLIGCALLGLTTICLSWWLHAAPAYAAGAAGPATTVSVQLNPSTIVANGTSTSIATATVTDATGAGVAGDTIVFSASDPGIQFASPVVDNGHGTYTATLTSSTTVGFPMITATDQTAGVSGGRVMTQTPYSTTVLSTMPTASVTNEQVTLIATVTSSATAVSPSGSVTFENFGTPISGCVNVPFATIRPNVGQTAACFTSFSASTSPEQLTAVFTPSSGSSVAGSTSSADAFTVGQDTTTTRLQSPGAAVQVGQKVTYSATVTPSHAFVPGQAGSFAPTGSVEFLDGSTPIKSCRSQPVIVTGATATATCTLSYRTTGRHRIAAVYSGNFNFNASTSSPASIVATPFPVLGDIRSTMQWTFLYTPTYTTILQLLVQDAPAGSTVLAQCDGQGCPFGKRAIPVATTKPCKRTSTHACPPPYAGTVDLALLFRNRHLHIGARITIEILKPRWVGRYFVFVMRAGHGPRVRIGCLAPGATRPNVGC